MVCTTCDICGGEYHWNWVDAFDKFGFDDGDGQIETPMVVWALEEAGYNVESTDWGLHNNVIISIKKDSVELIPYDNPEYRFGYSDPHDYFPEYLVNLLDEAFPPVF